MHRAGRIVLWVLTGVGLLAVGYLLLGDTLWTGGESGGSGAAGSESAGDLLGASGAAGLEAHGARRPSPEELAAKDGEATRGLLAAEGVFGRVTDAHGHPLKGVAVKLMSDPPALRRIPGALDPEPIHTAITDEQGEFVVGPSPPDGYAKLRAEAAGFAPTVQRVRQRGARVDLILDRGGALTVRLLDARGTKVEDAMVIHQAGTVVTWASSNEDGVATFPALPTGTGSLLVTKVGYGAVRDQDVAVAPGAKEERTLVLPTASEISGVVLDSDTQRPISGVQLRARYMNLPTLDAVAGDASATTGEDGRFRLAIYVTGQEQYILRASHDAYAEGRIWRNAQVQGEVEVKLVKLGEAVRGRVVDAERQPVAGVTVTYAWQQNEEPSEIPEASTEADGAFVIPLPPWATPGSGWVLVAVSDAAGVGIGQVRVPKKDEPATEEVEIRLGGTGTVAGKVADRGGAPVQGALVSLAPDWNAGRSRPGRPTVPWQLLRVLYDGQYHNLTAVTDAEGAYRITGVPTVDYRVSATYGLDEVTLEDSITVEAGETRQTDIALGEGGTLEGWVLDAEEKPVPGAYVSAQVVDRSGGNNWAATRPAARAQSDGRFILRGIGDGEYTVTANASGYGNVEEKNVARGTKDLVLRLKARGWIDGIVKVAGRPYRGTFSVQVLRMKPNANALDGGLRNGFDPGQQARTFNTDDGKFQVKGLDAGDYTVRASTSEGMIAVEAALATVIDGRGSRVVELEMVPGAVLTGTVREGETGAPISGAWVYAAPTKMEGGAAAPNAYAQTDVGGHYEIQGLGTGTYTITAWGNGTNFSRAIELTAGEHRTLELVRERPGTVTFVVTDQEGRPVGGARPMIRTEAGAWVNVDMNQMRKEGLIDGEVNWQALYDTNASGVLTRYHVPPGRCEVWVTKSGYQPSDRATITIASGANTEVRVTILRK